jgi:N-acetyl-ornithine/N-acetyl-lysine deacetylase
VTHIRYNNLEAAQSAITEQTAAVIIELVQGEGGVHVAHEGYVRELAALCRERGALLIVDEVQTAFGRTGRLFACEHYGLQPDILCLAKSLAGGVPMGAIGLGPRVMESGRITKGAHGSTFGGNPLACAAALATLDILEQEKLVERAVALGEYTLQRLQEMRSPLIREVRGRGLLIGIELNRRVQPYLEALCERGILALPAGPNVLRLLPPLVITEEQLKHTLDVIEELLSGPFQETGQDRRKDANLASSESQKIDSQIATEAPDEVENGIKLDVQQGLEQLESTLLTALLELEPVDYDRAREEHAIALLQSMLTIPSLSRQESTLAHYLVEQAQLMGLHAYVDEAGNFVASTHEQLADVQPIVLLGHMDTVPGNIPVRLEGGVLHGRGAVDAKGPLAAFICAAARAAHSKGVERPIVVIGAVEEEAATSRGARFTVQQYQPYACVIGEPSGSQAVTIGYKGRLLVDGYCLRSLSHTAGPLQSSNEIAVAFWECVRRHASEWNEQHAGNSAFASLQPSLRSINSGQDGLEEWTRFTIGYRLPPDYDIAALRSQLEQWAYKDDIHISFSGEEVAYQSTRTTSLARAFIAALRSIGVKVTFKNKTGTSDMNVVGPVWGQNIVAYGPGDSSLDHTPQEHIRITEYTHAISVLELVLRELQRS